MDARPIKVALILSVFSSLGATYRTPNFVVRAPSAEMAKKVGLTAEYYRDELAVAWLGEKMRRWSKPCQVTVKVGQYGAGGATSFAFDRGHVFGWRMRVQGSLERILDSVVPHEVSHTVFASHFRRPLPRWADEGAATLVEHESEKRRQRLMLEQVLGSKQRIPLRKLLSIKEYPRNMQNVLTLYAQGYSLADFLVESGGKARYLTFLENAHKRGWDRAIKQHYGFRNVEALEERWNGWVIAGSPRLNLPEGQQLADATNRSGRTASPPMIVRSQSPDDDTRTQASSPRSSPRERNSELVAPDPRPSQGIAQSRVTGTAKTLGNSGTGDDISQNSPRPQSLAATGRQRASNDGWSVVDDLRRPRPAPLARRRPLQKKSRGFGTTHPLQMWTGDASSNSADSRNRTLSPASSFRRP